MKIHNGTNSDGKDWKTYYKKKVHTTHGPPSKITRKANTRNEFLILLALKTTAESTLHAVIVTLPIQQF